MIVSILFSEPAPPFDVKITKSATLPPTSLVVKYQDERHVQKEYLIKMIPQDGGANSQDQDKLPVKTSELMALVHNLSPGTPYVAHVPTSLYGELSRPALSQEF